MDENKRQADKLLLQVAKHLDGKWTLDPRYKDSYWQARLIDGTGRGLFVNASNTRRLEISGHFPHNSAPANPLTISVSRSRTPEAIAADITRRFLPWYIDAYTEQEQAARAADEREARRTTLIVELSAILGIPTRGDGHLYGNGCTVKVHGPSDVTIELRNLSATDAKSALALLTEAGII